jgi:epoxide hydrolase-like predicted phosphatase
VRELFREDPEALALLRGLETGRLTDEEFESQFAALLGVAEHDGLIGRLFSGLRPDEAMLGAVRAARVGGVATGLISNSWGLGIYDRLDSTDMFDATVISGEVGLHKPQPEIYLLACERLGVEPAAAVFVDDLRENCAGAEEVGMTAILHRGSARTIARLEGLLGVVAARRGTRTAVPAAITATPRKASATPARWDAASRSPSTKRARSTVTAP